MIIIWLLFLVPVVALLAEWGRILLMRRKLPPGPFPFPIVGNHFQTPSVKPWITWEKWAKHYNSPMMTLWIGRHPRIILSDAWVASELMESRSDIFSSRPRLIVMGDAINISKINQTTLPYGDRWRTHRKLMHMAVGTQAVKAYRSFQSNESKLLTRDLLLDPNDYELSIERYSVSTVSIVGWGRRIDRKNDYVAQQALKVMDSVNYVVPGVYIMEAIPALMQLPSWVYQWPSQLHKGSAILSRYFYMLTQEGAEAAEDNFSKYMLESQRQNNLVDAEISSITANLIGGGVDTTSSTMISCILAMIAFPEVQAKAHAELDAVVGQDRSPTSADIDSNSLPYLAALVKETLRWRTVTILAGIPHANTVPFDYQGYHFPAGTNFTSNMWAIHRNERDYPDPDSFRPERFLGNGMDEGWARPYPNKYGCNPFGYGRRVCSGQPLAEQGLLYSLGRILWAFDMKPGLDDHGRQIKPDIFAFTASENMRPEPFGVRFTHRSDSIKQIILQEAAVAREELRVYDGETKISMEDAVRNPSTH
ncbi:cytochrome P450 [Polyplosphaeria fusca]|uniref:Cytochrome P450 n=1 Tax=Polyplosphaeria fusca TaxID=682080 RepID=A0A9P4R3Y8_9PLEO|nr:cytochrome P450 [Polyplosphaeria fusca]